jgi:SAM-dependent methyltransferase
VHCTRRGSSIMQMKEDIVRDGGSVRAPLDPWEHFFVLNSDTHASCSYRMSHQAAEARIAYDKTFEVGYYAALWRTIEKPLLSSVLRPLGGRERTSLDFACGTGRITKIAAGFFGSVVGVDVSQAMLSDASVPENVTLICADITRTPLERQFDVVTAFRFF